VWGTEKRVSLLLVENPRLFSKGWVVLAIPPVMKLRMEGDEHRVRVGW